MHTPLKFAVILAGCGNKDGAEIHESVLTLLSIDRAGHHYQCFAPDVAQKRVLNFLTNEEIKESRNVLVESARIARSNIKNLNTFNVKDFDVLVLPGGSGVAHNMCTYALDGAGMSVNEDVVRAVISMHEAKKPIGALCIAPVIIAKLIPGARITFGEDEKANAAFSKAGAYPVNAQAKDIVVDVNNKVVTTPCYMLNARISEIAVGIDALIQKLITLV